MTNPSETVEWLAVQFRDNADTSPGETHLEGDAAEVEALRDAFHAMLAALKTLERVTSHLHQIAGSGGQTVAGALLEARAAIATAAGRESARE